jgi:hypothetical protein
VNFIHPSAGELNALRADPLLCEQELDVRPEVAESIERAVGMRAGRVYWRSEHGHLYALELGDLGRGRPSIATVYGFWRRYEPRPAETEIDADLFAFCLWVAEASEGLDPADVAKVKAFSDQRLGTARGPAGCYPAAVENRPQVRPSHLRQANKPGC